MLLYIHTPVELLTGFICFLFYSTIHKKSRPVSGFFYFDVFLMRAARRDFFREAVFFLITPVFAALSSAWYAVERSAIASFPFPCVERRLIFLVISLSVARFVSLYAFLCTDARSAFFAPLSICIIGYYTQTRERKQVMCNKKPAFDGGRGLGLLFRKNPHG